MNALSPLLPHELSVGTLYDFAHRNPTFLFDVIHFDPL